MINSIICAFSFTSYLSVLNRIDFRFRLEEVHNLCLHSSKDKINFLYLFYMFHENMKKRSFLEDATWKLSVRKLSKLKIWLIKLYTVSLLSWVLIIILLTMNLVLKF